MRDPLKRYLARIVEHGQRMDLGGRASQFDDSRYDRNDKLQLLVLPPVRSDALNTQTELFEEPHAKALVGKHAMNFAELVVSPLWPCLVHEEVHERHNGVVAEAERLGAQFD